MAFQAQIREWVDDALRAVLGPLLERLDKVEAYIRAVEQTDEVPADPAPRGKGPERQAAKQAATAAVKAAPSGPPRTSGRPNTTAKNHNGS